MCLLRDRWHKRLLQEKGVDDDCILLLGKREREGRVGMREERMVG
jgi:hypothetical protein